MVTDSTHKMDPMDPMDPMDVRDYAEALGWVPVKEAYERRLYVLKHPAHERRQLAFPMDATAPDCAEAIEVAIERLAELSGVSQRVVVNRLWGLREDTVRVRVLSDGRAGQSIPLAFASSMLQGAQQLLLSAAHNVLEAKPHHPRLSRAEAVRLVEAAQFRHTEQGSFVVKVSCPLQAGELDPVPERSQGSLFDPHPLPNPAIPFARRTTLSLFQGVQDLVEAIERGEQDALVERAWASVTETGATLSSNLCEAVLRFQDAGLRNAVELSVDWSPLLATDPKCLRPVRIRHEAFPRIDEVRRALRPAWGPKKDTFVGTVERLDGEMEPCGKRSGDVWLALLLRDGESVRARVRLDAAQYTEADRAHMTDGAYVRVVGVLHPGRPMRLTDLEHFERLAP
ncbi:MAG TPA: hypothetical protein PKE31_20610 [Pseudomonadota bacterium]|nr:hypothetical protein [Pseudomonadota bacterium]